jgi:phenylalanyl-tRNA synthetase alpha subunit
MICPGKCYRRDDDDMTHSHEFGQIEGLVVDKGISMADLKGTLELFVKKMFGEKREIRLRSSYFPFTEPSVEVDVLRQLRGQRLLDVQRNRLDRDSRGGRSPSPCPGDVRL